MKKTLIIIALFALCFLELFSCAPYQEPNEEILYTIPEGSIKYTHLEYGNVIQDGKQAIFLNFVSDYAVTKLEIAGALLDNNGNEIYVFDTGMRFVTPSADPDLAIRIESNLIKNVKSVSFTKITAYTTEALTSS